MAEKLSESSWTGFAKKRELDDAALVKALSKFDKTTEAKPEPRLESLQEVEAQIAKQVVAIARRKKELGDKPWKEAKDKLDAMLAETGHLIKETRAAVAATAASAEKAEKADDDEDSPALLTTAMVPILRALKKPDVQMHALIATAGKNTAVLVMRRPVGMSRRKLLADFVDAKGGVKYIVGECLQEKGALTFVVQSPAAGLAKRIRAALLEQTALRLKVRVRGESGEPDEDGDDEDDEDEAGTESGAAPSAPSDTGPGTDQSGAPAKSTPEPAAGTSPEAQAWTVRLGEFQHRYDDALRAGHPEATKLRALMGFASEKADERHDYPAAIKALDMLEKLLVAPLKPAVEPTPAADPDLGKPGRAGLMATWRTERAGAIATLKQLATRIAKAGHKRSAKAIEEIKVVIERLVVEPATKKQAGELQAWLATDDLVQDICELEEDIQTPLTKALKALEPELAA